MFAQFVMYTVRQKNWATFFTVSLANVSRFLKLFQCRNQKEMAHNKNEKFPTELNFVATLPCKTNTSVNVRVKLWRFCVVIDRF